jgi:2-hydroxy-3-keto-5-methylthiopentenyl-1-phosphate phosphatase
VLFRSIEVKQLDLNPDCGRCGNCKRSHVRRYKDEGYQVTYIGDGIKIGSIKFMV